MPINKQKYNTYLTLKADPAMALMRMMRDHEKEMEEYMKECDKKIEVMMDEKMAKMEQKEPMHANFIQKIVNQAVAQVIGNATGEKGEKGDPGYTPIKEKDYFDGKNGKDGQTIIGPQGIPGKDGKSIIGPKGKDGENGKTPLKGIDYFTPKEIQEFMDEIKESLKLNEIINKLNELQKTVMNLGKTQQFGGQRLIHRGGMALEWETPSGTINGSNATFTLANTPYQPSQVMFFVNGLLQKQTDDYTISGATITTNTAPPTGSLLSAFYRRA